jgi:DNA-binding NarL/FixJ family response regulator
MARSLRVLVVDDHALIAESVAAALRASGLEVALADLGNRDRLVASVRALPPNLVLLDLELGGAIGDGTTLVRPFVQAGARVLVMSAVTDPVRIAAALEQGAVGHVPKSASFIDLLKTALAAARGEDVTSPARRQHLLQLLRTTREREAAVHAPFERLTPREEQVLRAIADGRSVGQIAKEWYLSESTVRSQVRGILTKLGVGSQIEAVGLALKVGWLQPAKRDSPVEDAGPEPPAGEDPHIPRQR